MSITTNLLAALQADQAVSNAFTTIEHSLLTELTVFEIKKEKLPSLILFPGEETTEPNEHDGFVAQYMTRHIHCLIVATITDIDASILYELSSIGPLLCLLVNHPVFSDGLSSCVF